MPLLDPKLMKKTGIFSLVTAEVSVLVGGGSWLGSWLDSREHTSPAFVASFATLGLVISFWRIKKLLQKQ